MKAAWVVYGSIIDNRCLFIKIAFFFFVQSSVTWSFMCDVIIHVWREHSCVTVFSMTSSRESSPQNFFTINSNFEKNI